MKILVVEDEIQLCDDIVEDLELERYTAERCYDGLTAWERILVESYDLVPGSVHFCAGTSRCIPQPFLPVHCFWTRKSGTSRQTEPSFP